MDDSTVESLEAALGASPDNQELRMLLVRGRLERREAPRAWELVRDLDPLTLGEEHRRVAARAALDAGHPEQALRHLAGDEAPPSRLLAARVHLALDQLAAGREAYDRAVAASPALEDRDLRQRLGARVHEFPSRPRDEGRRLRVISNDDTDDTELARLLAPESAEPVRFADVGGLDAVKEEIRRRIILPFQKPSLFRRFKKRVGGGILLYGPPGCGKTLLARATAGECAASFHSVAISDVLDMYIGESERKLHALFETARSSPPAVVFFDELEALGGKRQYSREGTSSKLVSQFLAEMDGFSQANQGVLVLAATNVPWAIDGAFRRPGRFDRVLFVPPPDEPARRAILERLLAERPAADDIDLAALARLTSGFSGADLRELVENAADAAIEASITAGEEVAIAHQHLCEALGAASSSTREWLTTARNYARYANEAGQYDEVLSFLQRHGQPRGRRGR